MKKVLVMLIIFSLLFFTGKYIYGSFIKATDSYAKTEAANILTRAINESVLNVLKNENVCYDDIATITMDKNGKISSIELDTVALNRLRAELTIAVMNTLCDIDDKTFYVHMGNILGSRLLSGRGGKISIKIVPLGTVASDTKNYFEAAGINQTSHRIMLDIRAAAEVVFPFSAASLEISTSICIAETIIVGEIPHTYIDLP